jgi:hypothetical protein
MVYALVILSLLLSPMSRTRAAEQPTAAVSSKLSDQAFLFEVVRHLYRWYLDETDAEKIVGQENVVFKVRDLHPKLDPGDRSQLGEIVMPQLGVSVVVKKADYTIEELGVTVENETFKIINVARGIALPEPGAYTEVKTSYRAMRDYGHQTRTLARFPEDNLLMRMRLAAREQIREYLEGREGASLENTVGTWQELSQMEQVLHLAPLSDVANEVWLFWETGRMLIRFASDIDLESTAVWEHEELAVDLYNIDEQTVVSLDEVAGSNAYMTRDQVGRALFNCIVLGRRLVLKPMDDAEVEREKTSLERKSKQ